MLVTFLGSGGSIPTEGRNHPAIVVQSRGWVFLLDAGEDVQRRIEQAGIGLNKRMKIFISHIHADHLIGLPGLLLRFSLLGRQRPLEIYGPPEIVEYVEMSQKTIGLGTSFQARVLGVNPGVLFQTDGLSVRAFEVSHRGKAYGFEIAYEKPRGKFLPEEAVKLGVPEGPLWGKLAKGASIELENGSKVLSNQVTLNPEAPLRIVYSGDTRPCSNLKQAAEDADLLICEAMYASEHEDLADERGHMTAAQAANLAKASAVGTLVLTHYSPRYDSEKGRPIIEEAKAIFPSTILARDLMRLKVTKREVSVIDIPSVQSQDE